MATSLKKIQKGVANFFKGKPFKPPERNLAGYDPIRASDSFKPVNFARIFDDLTGDEVTFVRGADGENRIQGAGDNGINISFRNLKGKPSLSDLVTSRNDVQLRDLGVSENSQIEYLATLANVTNRLRDLSNTIETVEKTDPMLLEANRGFIDSFKAANQQALDRGFDIRRNGIDRDLARMGLLDSSTALGAQVALARERTDSEIQNNFNTYSLAQGLKESSLDTMFKRGDQLVQEANIGLGLRGQDMARDLNQAQLNLAQSDQAIGARAEEMRARPLDRLIEAFVNAGQDRSLAAIGQDNNAMSNRFMESLRASESAFNQEKQQYSMKRNPVRELLNTAAGQFIGSKAAGMLGEGAQSTSGAGAASGGFKQTALSALGSMAGGAAAGPAGATLGGQLGSRLGSKR